MLHPHRARHLLALFAILLLPALPAMAATPLACGSYQATERDARFVIESPTQAVQLQDGQAPTRYLIRQQGLRILLVIVASTACVMAVTALAVERVYRLELWLARRKSTASARQALMGKE